MSLPQVIQMAQAPDNVRKLVNAWNKDHPQARRVVAKAVQRASHTIVQLDTIGKFGAPLSLSLGSNDDRTVTEALQVLAHYANSDGPTMALVDPGPAGKSAPLPYEEAPRDVVMVVGD